ncbi:hypothetical protein BH20ACT2_BH20ACT2_14620 [soil metagenome]
MIDGERTRTNVQIDVTRARAELDQVLGAVAERPDVVSVEPR